VLLLLCGAICRNCSTLYRLLKHTCLNCHQFKMGRKEVRSSWHDVPHLVLLVLCRLEASMQQGFNKAADSVCTHRLYAAEHISTLDILIYIHDA
jgi:hypothetical protein